MNSGDDFRIGSLDLPGGQSGGRDRDRPNRVSAKNIASKFRGAFTTELKDLMWTHGEPGEPHPDTLDLLDDILLEYMTDVCMNAHRLSGYRSRMKIDDLRFLFRHDPISLGRMEEILKKDEQVRKARNLVDLDFADIAKFGEASDQEVERAEATVESGTARTGNHTSVDFDIESATGSELPRDKTKGRGA